MEECGILKFVQSGWRLNRKMGNVIDGIREFGGMKQFDEYLQKLKYLLTGLHKLKVIAAE